MERPWELSGRSLAGTTTPRRCACVTQSSCACQGCVPSQSLTDGCQHKHGCCFLLTIFQSLIGVVQVQYVHSLLCRCGWWM